MRKSKAEAAETRQQIVAIAANEFRLNGITATGIVPLMSKAGLTQGGFYKHFESKDKLVAEACTVALDGLVERFKTASEAGGEQGFMSIVDSYLSAGHREDREEGCPLAAMGSELVRTGEDTRLAASQGFDDLVNVMAKSLDRRGAEQARSQAIFAMAAMVGAVTMSRMISDETAASRVLNEVKQHLGKI
jgi:TetR/AcrR family transcriptional repressor of nem operon